MATVIGSGRSTIATAGLQAFALVVGITRIYAGAHLPLDVAGGAALGILVGEATTSIRTRPTG